MATTRPSTSNPSHGKSSRAGAGPAIPWRASRHAGPRRLSTHPDDAPTTRAADNRPRILSHKAPSRLAAAGGFVFGDQAERRNPGIAGAGIEAGPKRRRHGTQHGIGSLRRVGRHVNRHTATHA